MAPQSHRNVPQNDILQVLLSALLHNLRINKTWNFFSAGDILKDTEVTEVIQTILKTLTRNLLNWRECRVTSILTQGKTKTNKRNKNPTNNKCFPRLKPEG